MRRLYPDASITAVLIQAIKLEGEQAVRLSPLSAAEVLKLVRDENFTWIDIQVDHASTESIRHLLADELDFHPATVEDCLHLAAYHQPKMDEEQDYRFITFIYYEHISTGKLQHREIHAYVGTNFVITLHRHNCPDYLAEFARLPRHITEYKQRAILFLHHILDTIADSFAPILHDLHELTDELEIDVLRTRRHVLSFNLMRRHKDELGDMRTILRNRRSLVMLRRSLAGELEIVKQLIAEYDYEGAPETSEEIAIYFRDIADHTGKYLEIIEGLDRAMTHLMEVHSLVTGHRTNEIIYILTLISTVMLPLNLIVGFFGMNFDNLWFMHSSFGVWGVTFLMVAVTFGLFLFFRSKEWI
jgi:magnesium transporter